MLDFFQDTVLVVVTVAGALLFMTGLNMVWPAEKRRSHNDLIGWQLSILGTTYAVILGFMLYTVWTNFGVAEANVEQEAGALANLYTIASALPEPQRTQIQKLAHAYADTAISTDWPGMSKGQEPQDTFRLNDRMWHTLVSPQSVPTSQVQEQAILELSKLTDCRRIRLLQSGSRLPGILWWVLLVGGVLTIVSCCMFGAESARLHTLQVFAFSLLIALCLVAIADIDRPFQGSVHVSDLAFRRALQLMDEN
ncbi:MAG TPA: DUF4239 domain-containing protein [Bryocella sp.]|nr:DUF4239 domain-containing protein [Bryocella sp.]